MDFSAIERRLFALASSEDKEIPDMADAMQVKTWNVEWFKYEAHKVLSDIDYLFWCPDRSTKLVVGRVVEMGGRKCCVFADDKARDGVPEVIHPKFYARTGLEPAF